MNILTENTTIFTENFTDLFIKTNFNKTKFANEVGIKHSQIEHYLQGTIPTIKVWLKFVTILTALLITWLV